MWKNCLLWLRIIRPGTLCASIAPVAIGLLVVVQSMPLNWFIAFVTLCSSVGIQIASNLINDYYDFKKGLDKAGRLGPRRALAENEVTPAAVRQAIFITLLLTGACAIYLVTIGGWPILVISLLSVLCAWLYTATPFSLSYLGIADLFVLVFFGPVATAGTTYLQTLHFSQQSFWLGMVCGFISTAVLTVNNLRDRKSDALAGKRSIVVRFGKRFGEKEYLVLFVLSLPCLWFAHAAFFSYFVALYGFFLYYQLLQSEGAMYNKLLVKTGFANMLFTVFYGADTLFF